MDYIAMLAWHFDPVNISDSDRYGFKVKFDQYVDGQTLNGLDMLVLICASI